MKIKEISLENIWGGKGKSPPFVVIQLLSAKKIKFNGVREGTIALFSALEYRMKSKHSLSLSGSDLLAAALHASRQGIHHTGHREEIRDDS